MLRGPRARIELGSGPKAGPGVSRSSASICSARVGSHRAVTRRQLSWERDSFGGGEEERYLSPVTRHAHGILVGEGEEAHGRLRRPSCVPCGCLQPPGRHLPASSPLPVAVTEVELAGRIVAHCSRRHRSRLVRGKVSQPGSLVAGPSSEMSAVPLGGYGRFEN
jgi:hypothetical protein